MTSFDYDVVIIGSGFGGSVADLRAAEKGYRVGIMESGVLSATKYLLGQSPAEHANMGCWQEKRILRAISERLNGSAAH